MDYKPLVWGFDESYWESNSVQRTTNYCRTTGCICNTISAQRQSVAWIFGIEREFAQNLDKQLSVERH